MEYVKGKPYFTDTTQKIKQFDYLAENIDTEVVIVGGGISGLITLYNFAKQGIECVLIEKSRLGYCSTSCATALLEYQLDDFAHELYGSLNSKDIVSAYNLGLQSLDKIDEFIAKYGNRCEYSRKDTIVFTQDQSQMPLLCKEYEYRRDNGFKVSLFNEFNNPFQFPIKAGLYAPKGGGDFNPYLFCQQMVEVGVELGGKIYENTLAKEIVYTSNGVKIITNYGIEINAKKLICATGYNTKLFTNKKLCDKFITYTIVTSPIKNFEWYNNALMQDALKPYHYIKLTKDNRIVLGGEDIKFWFDTINDKIAKYKYNQLKKYLFKLFPDLSGSITIDYEFCGTFSATDDNLGVYGVSSEHDNLWYSLSYGANGIINSMVGAEMLAKMYKGELDENLKLFDPSRRII